jgi:hypothetical protein
LCGGGGNGTLAQLFARRLTRPGAWIDVTYGAQPLFGFRECWEITHVQAEALAAFLKTAADKEAEALEFGLLRIRQRHGRRRRC